MPVYFDIPAATNYQAIPDAAMQAIAHAMGVGYEVVGSPVVLAALQVAAAGLLVPAARPAERYQLEHWAYMAYMHPHQTILHLPEGCCPHLGTHTQYVCGHDFYCLDNMGT